MNDNIVPRRLYFVNLLNSDIQKQNQDKFIAENIKIGPSGVLECDRVFTDIDLTLKTFYSGEFWLSEMDPEEVENFKNPHDCEHDHDDMESQDDE